MNVPTRRLAAVFLCCSLAAGCRPNENGADDAAPASHTRLIHEAAGSADKTYRVIEGANHYYKEQPDKLAEAVTACGAWLEERNFT